MQLVLDIGNTAIKAGWFNGAGLVSTAVYNNEGEVLLALSIKPAQRIMVASVRAGEPDFLKELEIPVLILNSNTPLPFKNSYKTPETLGADRLANAAGAFQRFPGKNALVLDCGTCIKADLVTSEGAYAGGSISPGLKMRYQSLNHFTGRLPLLEPAENPELIGGTTAESIHSGVINGMVAEIDGIISRYHEMFPDLHCILTGGDHVLFSGKLKSRIFAAPSLTLEGLNSILLRL